jgi:hypothetical protein
MTEEGHPPPGGGIAWLWPIIVPVAPVLFAIALMEVVSGPAIPALTETAAGADAVLKHSGARLVFAAAVAVHTAVCIAAMVYFAAQMRRMGNAGSYKAALAVLAFSLFVLGAMVLFAHVEPRLTIYRLTFFEIDRVLRASSLASDLAGAGPPGSFSPLAVAVLFPSGLGIVSVVLAAGVCAVVLCRHRPAKGDASKELFQESFETLLRCFYALSAVLVTSTVAAMLFFQLGTDVVAGPKGIRDAFAAYASGLATFWGAIYTATLFSAFVTPMALLCFRARSHASENSGKRLPLFGDWLADYGLDTKIAANLKNIMALLAPLLVWPIGQLANAAGA